jgi:hypothetical protein
MPQLPYDAPQPISFSKPPKRSHINSRRKADRLQSRARLFSSHLKLPRVESGQPETDCPTKGDSPAMWKKLYSNSGLILLAILAAGVWFRNLRSFYPPKSNDFAYSDELLASSPTPAPSFEELLEQEWLKLTSEDVLRRVRTNATAGRRDGSYSHAANRRGTRSHHGGVAQWLSR